MRGEVFLGEDSKQTAEGPSLVALMWSLGITRRPFTFAIEEAGRAYKGGYEPANDQCPWYLEQEGTAQRYASLWHLLEVIQGQQGLAGATTLELDPLVPTFHDCSLTNRGRLEEAVRGLHPMFGLALYDAAGDPLRYILVVANSSDIWLGCYDLRDGRPWRLRAQTTCASAEEAEYTITMWRFISRATANNLREEEQE